MPKHPPFLMWYDDNPKIAVGSKIAAAVAAYRARFRGAVPTLVLMNDLEVNNVGALDIEVRGVNTVHRNTFWVGQQEEAT
jgi:hypothetical protein